MGAGISNYNCQCIVIPLMFDGEKCLRGHLIENLPSYSGATLQLTFTVDNQFQRREMLAATPFQSGNQVVVGSGAANSPWILEVGYIMASISEVSQGSIDLQL